MDRVLAGGDLQRREIDRRLRVGHPRYRRGCLPRLCHVPHDGRSAPPVPREVGLPGERVLENSVLSSKSRGMDRLLAARPDPAVLHVPGRRGSISGHARYPLLSA